MLGGCYGSLHRPHRLIRTRGAAPKGHMDQNHALVAAAFATALLAVAHALLPALRRRLGGVQEGVAASVGGGVASAYVFLHLLPELARGNEEVAEAFSETMHASGVSDLLLFVAALAGFIALYGLDHVAAGPRRGERAVFRVHLGVYAIYNGLITYTLPTLFRTGAAAAVLFSVAMGVHFLLSDRGLAEHHGQRFAQTGRPVLVGALVAGLGLGWLFAPTSTVVVSVLLALLAGFVLFNVFSDELPNSQRLRFPVFAVSATVYAALLLAAALVEG